MPSAAEPVKRKPGLGALLRNLVLLVIAASIVYGYMLRQGRFPWPAWLPPLESRPEEAPPPSEEEMVPWDEGGATEEPEKTDRRGDIWRNDDFLQGARLFNKALADYKAYQSTRDNPGVLVDVDSNCRDAIAHFEACKDEAPAHINIDQYIEQCYGLIANVHHSTTLNDAPAESDRIEIIMDPSPAAPPSAASGRNVVFIDDEPETVAAPEQAPEPQNLLRLGINVGWEKASVVPSAFDEELKRLLMRQTEPVAESMVDPSVMLYPGITCMMTARDAARVLNKELPFRRNVETPGFLSNGFYMYQLEGDFAGASELSLVVDGNDRVVMVQLFDARHVPAHMEEALYSSNWSVVDFVHGRRLQDGEGPVAYRVRKRDNLIRIDGEVADPSTADKERSVMYRTALMMPVQVAGMLLHAVGP